MTVRGWCRVGRAGVFVAVCVLLAALGHVTMSGTAVPWWAMAAGAAGTAAVGWSLAGRERGRTLIVTVVTAVQAVLHEIFSLSQTHAPAVGPMSHTGASSAMDSMDMGAMGGMDMGGMDMGSATDSVHGTGGMEHLHGMVGTSGAASVGMFAAHLLAAVLCGLWLAHGERAVFRVLRAAAAWLAAPLRLLLALPARWRPPAVPGCRDAAGPPPVRLLLRSSLTFRGPPPTGAAVT